MSDEVEIASMQLVISVTAIGIDLTTLSADLEVDSSSITLDLEAS